jgi:hypothetical protein
MKRKIIPWPLQQMYEAYQAGWTIQEIADMLASPEWQQYWFYAMGEEYHPTQKTVNSVMKRRGFALRKTGAPLERNTFWRGGRVVEQPEGYILVKTPGHPYANAAGYVREHRLVMEKHLGRYLEPHEVVHHKDDDPSNNDIDNLELFDSNAEHLAATITGKSHNVSADGRRRLSEAKANWWKRKKHDDEVLHETSDRSIA